MPNPKKTWSSSSSDKKSDCKKHAHNKCKKEEHTKCKKEEYHKCKKEEHHKCHNHCHCKRGPQGPKGDTGDNGQQGFQGPQGPAGPIGLTGSQGPIGNDGLQGPAGNDGLQGPAGPQGPIGNDGLQGPAGNTGPQGPAGNDGLQGPAGNTGPQGPAGNDGPAGQIGPQGPTGNDGPAGPAGNDGPAGPAGPSGSSGLIISADFFALMPPDNAATVAPGTAVSFPQDGPITGGIITRTGPTTFNLASIGMYQVFSQVSVTEAGQLILTLNGSDLAYTVSGRATGTSQIIIMVNVQTTVINSILSVVNPAGNSTALTITPLAGGTRPVSAHLLINYLGVSS